MTARAWRLAGRHLLTAIGLAAAGCTQHKPSIVPPQVVKMDFELLDEFYEEIQEYVELRRKVVDLVPPLPPDATAEQIATRQKALTRAIVQFRRKAKQGEIFKRDIEAAFRRLFKEAFATPEGPSLIKEIRSGNPRVEGVPKASDPTVEVKHPISLAINAVYPDGAPYSSVPPTLLLQIPVLPDQVRYRFVGRALIIRDTEANVILDFIRDIVPDPTTPR